MAIHLTRSGVFAFVAPSDRSSRNPGFFRRFLTALQASREAEARRHIARYQHQVERIEALSKPAAATSRSDLPF